MNFITTLTPEESQDVLRTLISFGVVTERQIAQAVRRSVQDTAKRIERLQAKIEAANSGSDVVGGLSQVSQIPTVARNSGNGSAVRGRALKRVDGKQSSSVTAEQLHSRQIQGQYLGALRHIPKGKQGVFKRLAAEKGREAAIRAMKRFAKDGTMPDSGNGAQRSAQRTATTRSATRQKGGSLLAGARVKRAAKQRTVKNARPRPEPILDEEDEDVSNNFVPENEGFDEADI